jgi:hypothetical protein
MLHKADDIALRATAAGVILAIAVGVAVLLYAAFLFTGIIPRPTLLSIVPSLQSLIAVG